MNPCLLLAERGPWRVGAVLRVLAVTGSALVMLLALQGCTKKADANHAAPVKHADLTKLDGGINRITLSAEAVKRLRLEFVTPVKAGEQLTLPYKALLYDPTGKEWSYVSETPTTFKRMALKVSNIDGETVHYTDGPQPTQQVVTWGAAQLFGIEFGIGK